MYAPRQFVYTFILVHVCVSPSTSFPNKSANSDMEIITVDEVVRTKNQLQSSISITGNTAQNNTSSSSLSSGYSSEAGSENDASNEQTMDIADDLIFLAEREHQRNEMAMQQLGQQTDAPPIEPAGSSQKIDLITSAEEFSLTAASFDASVGQYKSSREEYVSKSTKDADYSYGNVTLTNVTSTDNHNRIISDDDVNGSKINGISSSTTPQIELRTKYASVEITKNSGDVSNGNFNGDGDGDVDVDGSDDDGDDDDGEDTYVSEHLDIASIETSTTPIDMSDFVALIPAAAVKSIVASYYLNDPEVQRAYAYLNSQDFIIQRQRIIELPEVKAFLRYLNGSGLDVIEFMSALTNMTSKPDEALIEDSMADIGSGSEAIIGNEIESDWKHQYMITTSTFEPEIQATTEEQLKGLHGLVESILDILPQDQILATFFDKLESNEQFSKLVGNIGRPAFAKILHKMQNSPQLRIVVFNLHNNGIYITKIMDSMKAYFFLGTF